MLKFFLCLFFVSAALATPILQMNKALEALTELIPFMADNAKFTDKKNEKKIEASIGMLRDAFKNVKHQDVIKQDLFAPSYELINENLSSSLKAFQEKKKDYAYWRLKEITSLCLDCHTRLPVDHVSSFQNGDLQLNPSKFSSRYDLGVAQLIVRRYPDAKTSFTAFIEEKMVKKDYEGIILPFKQILLIEAKLTKDPDGLIKILNFYRMKKEMPEEMKMVLMKWEEGAEKWKKESLLSKGLRSEEDVKKFIKAKLLPLKSVINFNETHDVDLLISSGLLSNYLFENPLSKEAPEVIFWLGWIEKYLKQDQFFGSGDLFLKQCVRRYPASPFAKQCLNEYKESVKFEFSGSGGMSIPFDVQMEIQQLEKLIQTKKP